MLDPGEAERIYEDMKKFTISSEYYGSMGIPFRRSKLEKILQQIFLNGNKILTFLQRVLILRCTW